MVRHARVFREKQGINLLTGRCVQKIDPLKQMASGVTTDGQNFEIPYDRLLIATGSSLCLRQVLVHIDELIGLESPLLGFADKFFEYGAVHGFVSR